MRSMPHRRTWALWTLGSVITLGCAQGTTLPAGVGGAGGAGGSGGTGPSSSSSSSGSSSSSSSSSGASSSGSSSSSASSSSSSSSASSSSGTLCGYQQHLCSGSCEGNTIETGCFTSTSCSPCPTPTHGKAVCGASGVCDLQCDTGYQANAAKTDCEVIPPPPECCDDAECPFLTVCLDGYCRSPFASACDPARCNTFCQCKAGGTPESLGTCNLDVIIWECLCSP